MGGFVERGAAGVRACWLVNAVGSGWVRVVEGRFWRV